MRDILRSVSKLSISIGLNIFSSLIKNKILSLIVGPAGLVIYSQIVSLSGLAYTILPIGSMGLTRYISNYYEDKRINEIGYLLSHFFKRNLIFSIVASIVIIAFRETISSWLFSGSEYSGLLFLFAVFIPFNLLLNFLDLYLKSIRKINAYAFFLSINSVVSLLCTVPLIYFLGIEGAVLAMILSVLLNIVTGFIILKRYNLFLNFKNTSTVENSVVKNIYQFGIAGLVSMGIQNITILSIRSLLTDRFGLAETGLFQCVYALSAGYFGVFFTLMGNYSIPKVSSLKSTSMVVEELNSTVKFLLLLYIPLIVIMFIGRSFIIPFLYSNEFADAKYLLIYQLPAELVRAFSWVMGLWLISYLEIKKWIILEVIFYVSFFIFSYFLMDFYSLGIESVSISYLVSYVIFFFINYFFAVRNINFRFTPENIKFILLSSLLLLITFSVSFFNEFWGYFTFLPLLVVWAMLVFKKGEFQKLKEIISYKYSNK